MINDRALPLAVITGGGRGIGRAVAQDLLARGHRVVIAEIDATTGASTAEALGPNATGRRFDVADTGSLQDWVDEVERTFGPVDLWINNAGIMPTGRLLDQDPDLIDRVIDINLRGLVHCTRHLAGRMVERGTGKIINIASATAVKPLAGLAVYSGTKFGVLGFSAALRRELIGSGVQISVVLPYLAATPLGAGIQAQRGFRIVTPEQVSREVMRAIDTGRFAHVVPRRLAVLLKIAPLLPVPVQDLVDDLIDTDRIGLGGDPGQRVRYLRDLT